MGKYGSKYFLEGVNSRLSGYAKTTRCYNVSQTLNAKPLMAVTAFYNDERIMVHAVMAPFALTLKFVVLRFHFSLFRLFNCIRKILAGCSRA
jgi:hypothetical protein